MILVFDGLIKIRQNYLPSRSVEARRNIVFVYRAPSTSFFSSLLLLKPAACRAGLGKPDKIDTH
jgi:hypothetical protein